MKFWQLQKLCLENAYSVKRVGNKYFWKKNNEDRSGESDTVISTYQEIKNDIENEIENKTVNNE
jgi:hypothetical protein